jgi:hypothetical protein
MDTPLEKTWTLLSKMNNSLITQEDWQNASDYAKKDLKRKCLLVIDEVIENLEPLCISHLGTYTNPKIEYWKNVQSLLVAL